MYQHVLFPKHVKPKPGAAVAPGMRRSGQAMVEMVVAMVVIVVLVSGLLQIARLAVAHTESMHEARRLAGELSMRQVFSPASPSFIMDWDAGADDSRYSRDDVILHAPTAEFKINILQKAHPEHLSALLPDNPVSSMMEQPLPQYGFDMVHGFASRQVTAPPAIRNLIYDADPIDVRGEAWMIYTRGIY